MTDTKKSGEIPVVQKHLEENRSELKSEITTLRLETKSSFEKVDSRFSEMEARFDKVDARFSEMEARFDKVDARFSEMEARFDTIDANFNELKSIVTAIASSVEKMIAENHGMKARNEEQENRNKYVLDGHTNLHDRQDRFEKEIRSDVSEIKNTISRMNTTN